MSLNINNIHNTNNIIDIKGLSKSFNGKLVVDDVSLKVAKGDVYGFLGPNGSGKTTTIRMICGLLTSDAGEGSCLGYDLKTQADLIKLNVGYMTQKFSLYDDLSIEENLKFVAQVFRLSNPKVKVQEAIERLGIGQKRKKQLTGMLSGGWKQRLALAAATIHQPKLLLLDEPTAGVDPKARREFWDEIHRLAAEGVTTLVSTHYMDEAQRCNKLAYIAYGKLLVHGSCEQIIDSAKLQTWQVEGGDLHKLATKLRELDVIDQVAFFGQNLHVSAKSNLNLESVFKPYLDLKVNKTNNQYKFKKIQPGLEDVFIHLMSSQQDNFA